MNFKMTETEYNSLMIASEGIALKESEKQDLKNVALRAYDKKIVVKSGVSTARGTKLTSTSVINGNF
jgi:hypothetical protein